MHIVKVAAPINFSDFNDTKECLSDYKYDLFHVILKCPKCGQLLIPKISHYGPNSCGWRKVKGKWICHQCYYGWGGFDKSPEEVVKERNEKTKKELLRYLMSHPCAIFISSNVDEIEIKIGSFLK